MNICHICLKKIVGAQKYPGYHNQCVTALLGGLSVSPKLTFDKRVFKADFSQHFTRGMSMSGVQKKLSMKIENNTLVPTNKGGKYILKPTVDEFPEVSANEHLSMKLGELFSIETPYCGLLKFSDNELVYVIKRFDWSSENTQILKEDMAQIFQLERNREETYKYSKSYEEVGLKILEITGGKSIQVLDFFRRVIFCFLGANGDYHLKNISVQNVTFRRDGLFDGLTPNYDSVMTSIYLNLNQSELALDLFKDGEFSKEFERVGFLTRPDFDLLAERIGLNPAASDIVYSEMKKKIPLALVLIENSFLSADLKRKFRDLFISRAQKLTFL